MKQPGKKWRKLNTRSGKGFSFAGTINLLMELNPIASLKSFFELLKTAEFSKGIRFAVAAVLPIVIAGYFEQLQLGIAMAIGVLLSSPSDVPGSLRRRLIGLSFSVLSAVAGTLLAGYAAGNTLLFLPVLIFLMFGFSMISVYGFRASLIAFSGLFAVVLSMAKVASETSIITHAVLIGAGGLWYMGITLLVNYLSEKKDTELLLAEIFDLTAEYLEIRTLLLQEKPEDSEKLQKQLIQLQVTINEKHEIIREMLISRRRTSGRSGVARRKLLIFMEIVDILELAMSNPVNYERIRRLFGTHQEKLGLVKDWTLSIAGQLREISHIWKKGGKYKTPEKLHSERQQIFEIIQMLEKEATTSDEKERLLVYRNLWSFKEKQYQKILSIERLLKEWEGNLEFGLRRKDAARFLTTKEYEIKTLLDHLDFKSPIFRHALRLTAALVVGYLIGKFFHFQNAYWILLTTLVIMRPGYALTQERFKQRLYGTLIGGAVAVSIVLLIQNKIVYGILAVITLVLAFSMIQRNYKTAAAFITLNVVFVYSLLKPDALAVIQYRVLDTVIGAGLAFLANRFLWPTWEYSTIDNFISESIKSNLEFLKHIESQYRQKKLLPTAYKLARKKAFLAMGDLSAAFQRMAQEPKTSAEELDSVFRVVSLNQEFLSSTASLGTFINSHFTTSATEHFKNYMEGIRENLLYATGLLEQKSLEEKMLEPQIKRAEEHYKKLFGQLLDPDGEDFENKPEEEREKRRHYLQEVQVIMDQLKWLFEISDNLKTSLQKRQKA